MRNELRQFMACECGQRPGPGLDQLSDQSGVVNSDCITRAALIEEEIAQAQGVTEGWEL
jgi:hypothetical protein